MNINKIIKVRFKLINKTKKLILIEINFYNLFLEIWNSINLIFQKAGIKSLVINTVLCIYRNNIILVIISKYNTTFLIEKVNI